VGATASEEAVARALPVARINMVDLVKFFSTSIDTPRFLPVALPPSAQATPHHASVSYEP